MGKIRSVYSLMLAWGIQCFDVEINYYKMFFSKKKRFNFGLKESRMCI